VLVEGHVRLTAFFLFPEMLPEELQLYLGTAIGLDRWGLLLDDDFAPLAGKALWAWPDEAVARSAAAWNRRVRPLESVH
jgi:hypothetical protein